MPSFPQGMRSEGYWHGLARSQAFFMQRDAFPTPRLQRMRLTELPAGTAGRVCELAGEPAVCVRLREMGFCESAVIEKIAGKRMLICQLCETRIALSDAAASYILVEPI
jgi:ferrous iron transport protein A